MCPPAADGRRVKLALVGVCGLETALTADRLRALGVTLVLLLAVIHTEPDRGLASEGEGASDPATTSGHDGLRTCLRSDAVVAAR